MISSPYKIITLKTDIQTQPYQLNNNIFTNMKNNLEKKIIGRCFKNYGFVQKIYKIIDNGKSRIEPENLHGSIVTPITFSCRVCMPIKNEIYVCEIFGINNSIIKAKCGPIIVIITIRNEYKNVFIKDAHNKLAYVEIVGDKKKYNLVSIGDFILAKINVVDFHNGDTSILATGELLNMADPGQIAIFHDYHLDDLDKKENIDQQTSTEDDSKSGSSTDDIDISDI